MSVTFRPHQDVAVVEHDDATRTPRKDGRVLYGTVVEAGGVYVQVKTDSDRGRVFYQETGWQAWTGDFGWRLVPLCAHCEEPITGIPVTAEPDPLHRVWCRDECLDDAAQASYEQHYQPGVAT